MFYVWRLLYIFCRCLNDIDRINIHSTYGTGMSDIVIIVNSISVLVQRFNSCSNMPLNRCSSTEMCWNKKMFYCSLPEWWLIIITTIFLFFCCACLSSLFNCTVYTAFFSHLVVKAVKFLVSGYVLVSLSFCEIVCNVSKIVPPHDSKIVLLLDRNTVCTVLCYSWITSTSVIDRCLILTHSVMMSPSAVSMLSSLFALWCQTCYGLV